MWMDAKKRWQLIVLKNIIWNDVLNSADFSLSLISLCQFRDSTLQHTTKNITLLYDLLYIHIIVFTATDNLFFFFNKARPSGINQGQTMNLMQYFAEIWNNLYQNHEAGGINLILICIRLPQVKGKLWLTFFAQSRLPGCQQNLAIPVRPSGGNQGGVWFSLWLDRKYGFLFRINRTSQGPVHQPQGFAERIRSQLLNHHLELAWQDRMRQRWTVCLDLNGKLHYWDYDTS